MLQTFFQKLDIPVYILYDQGEKHMNAIWRDSTGKIMRIDNENQPSSLFYGGVTFYQIDWSTRPFKLYTFNILITQ